MTTIPLLTPYSSLPSQNLHKNACILLVGAPDSGKRSFGSILQSPNEFGLALQLRLGKSLPLPEILAPRPHIDFIVLMLSMNNKESFHNLKKCLIEIDPEFLLGRTWIIATNANKVSQYAFERTELEECINSLYDIPLFYVDFQNDGAGEDLRDKLLRTVDIASGYHRNITLSYLRTPLSG
ncbi:hypothetical protein K7432_000339 [Basidiobolus ranarum]|uniref:Centromere protein M n=1 Tax=Basidiobolus ranarum TaxID=34480 RepID=A0ABR2WBD0_9FUNG